MRETSPLLWLDPRIGTGLPLLAGDVEPDGQGALFCAGRRPGPGWHRHGCFQRSIRVLHEGRLCEWVLRKQRWLDVAKGRTCHSRPACELPRAGFTSLVVVLLLWLWLDGGLGLDHPERREVLEELEGQVSTRTLRRWLRRAVARGMELQQALRRAVLERIEPRPAESLFRSGLPSPDGLSNRPFRFPNATEQVWRGMTLLLRGATKLSTPVVFLLAEARRRWPSRESPFPI